MVELNQAEAVHSISRIDSDYQSTKEERREGPCFGINKPQQTRKTICKEMKGESFWHKVTDLANKPLSKNLLFI